MTRADRSRGMPDYVPRSLWSKRDDPVEQTSTARRLALDDRKERFDQINQLAHACGDAWLVSICGDPEMWIEALPTSTFPDELRASGYRLRDEGTRERIVPAATTEVIVQGKRKARTLTHAGLVQVLVYSFLL